MSTNHLVADLPQTLSYEIDDDITPRRVTLGMHRWGIKPKRGEITRTEYMVLHEYFYERRTIDTRVAEQLIMEVGRDKVLELLGKEYVWIAELRKGHIHMNVKQYEVLSEHVRACGALRR